MTGWERGYELNRVLIIPLLVPLFIMAYYYFKTIAILKNDLGNSSPIVKSAIRILYLYPAVQFVTVVPILVLEWLNHMFMGNEKVVSFLTPARLLLGLSGFGNSMVLLYQYRSTKAKNYDEERNSSISYAYFEVRT